MLQGYPGVCPFAAAGDQPPSIACAELVTLGRHDRPLTWSSCRQDSQWLISMKQMEAARTHALRGPDIGVGPSGTSHRWLLSGCQLRTSAPMIHTFSRGIMYLIRASCRCLHDVEESAVHPGSHRPFYFRSTGHYFSFRLIFVISRSFSSLTEDLLL
jgi:hypothetical protein